MAFTLMHAHAMAMVIAWMVFGSTGVLFARYGRSLRCGRRRQLLGKAVWFQIHRLLLSMTPLLTLVGFFFMLVRRGGQWTNPQTADVRSFIHSIFGGVTVCCCIVQIWLALYRCHPQSRFRFIFDWSHRLVGALAFALVVPAIFLIVTVLSRGFPQLLPIYSCWTAWTLLLVVVLEKIQYTQRASVIPMCPPPRTDGNKPDNVSTRPDAEAGTQIAAGDNRKYEQVKLLLLVLHTIVSVVLATLFLTFLCK